MNPALPLASLQLTSGWGAALSILVLGTLFVVWVVCVFLVVTDAISAGAKVLWFLFLTVLAPIGIPAYLLARHGRH